MAISITGFAQDDGFYVIPIPTEKIVIEEVCTGTPIGGVVFTVTETPRHVNAGDTYLTSNGDLVEITGSTGNPYSNNKSITFRVAPKTLPTPTYGVKGPFFSSFYGATVYARYL